MHLLEISLEQRVIFGISGMVLLFTSFLIVFVVSQRKKLQYHKELHALHEEQQQYLTQQNTLLEKRVAERTEELEFQKNELQKSLADLNLAQLQLIQKEKMASLGELTAGIAHEIQNPLNFVNNFSDLTKELADELQQELKTGDREEAIAIAASIIDNIERISHHGKRAGSIVKSMLEHSKGDTGQKEPTDINKLASDCLKLSYNSLLAKNNAFNATVETVFDDSIGKIDIIPQAMQRVFVNLFNNAFFAVNEKNNAPGENYKPLVAITTKRAGDKVLITISDNGTGIPPKILDKIFQPFFTTKPTGEGTGLGLSLSYDIVKAHGGDIKAESVAGESTTFSITLPG
jgi:two-component system NtrC family sensor kinase